MKRLLLVLFFIASVTSAFAAELKITGDMYVQGNKDVLDKDTKVGGTTTNAKANEDFFEYDLNINANLVVNENCTVITKLTFDKAIDTGQTADGTASAADAGLALERAYINYKFAPFLQLNTGLMQGGKWATNFGDTEINVMRVQFFVALSADMMFWATYEKNTEKSIATSTITAPGDEKVNEDSTTYFLSGLINVGGIKLWPLLKYVTDNTTAGKEKVTMAVDFGVTAALGMINLAAEAVYASYDTDTTGVDTQVYMGGYADVSANLAPAKVGVAVMYLSADKDKGSYWCGDDLNFTTVVGDVNEAGTFGLVGVTAAKVYGEFAMDKLTLGAALAYFMSTDDKVAANGGLYKFAAYEVDVNAKYAFDANASYEIGAGYAGIEYENATGTAKIEGTQYRLYNKFAVKF